MYSLLTRFKEIREGESGFTLIELLIVILIIGILAAIAIPMFLNQRKVAVDSTVKSDIRNAATALETWALKRENAGKPIPNHVIDAESGAGTPLAFINILSSIVPAKTYTSSPGNVLHVYGTDKPGEYCIIGANAGGDAAADGMTYDSKAGGLNKVGEACDFNQGSNTVVPGSVDSKIDKAVTEAGASDGSTPGGGDETGGDETGPTFTGNGRVYDADTSDEIGGITATWSEPSGVLSIETDSPLNGSGHIVVDIDGSIYEGGTINLVDGKGTVNLSGVGIPFNDGFWANVTFTETGGAGAGLMGDGLQCFLTDSGDFVEAGTFTYTYDTESWDLKVNASKEMIGGPYGAGTVDFYYWIDGKHNKVRVGKLPASSTDGLSSLTANVPLAEGEIEKAQLVYYGLPPAGPWTPGNCG